MEMEVHERDEWFRINGKMVRNPHATLTFRNESKETYGRGTNL